MAIVLDQQTVFNEFTNVIAPTEVAAVLIPHIVGPQAELHRYANANEKPGINVGPYIPGTPTSYPWPGKISDSLVDLDYVKLFIDNALLQYYQDLEGVGQTITAVANFMNRIIISGATGFKTNGSFARLAALKDRDVTIGDIVFLKHSSTTFYSSVVGLVADVVPAVVASATSDAANAGTQILASSTVQTAGTVNDVAATDSAAAYNGLPTGDINETYTITVITGSTGGDATTARLNVLSGSGRDNQTNITPAAFASPTTIGTRGLTVTWTHTVNDLLVGQVWTVTVAQAFTAPVPTSGGTYSGTDTTTYIVEVSLGGKYADPTQPQITVVNAIGTDSSGPTTVTATATFVPIGTKGVTIKFSQAALRDGDKYYVSVTAAGTGAYRTIVLNDNLPAALIAAGDMELDLSIQKNIQVPQERVSAPPTLNWTADQSGVDVNSGIDAYDSTLTNMGVLFSVPVVSGPSTAVFINYRAWMTQWVDLVGQVVVGATQDPVALTAAALGTVDPDNPLAYGVYKAALNSNTQPVSFSSVADPTSLDDWTTAAQDLIGLPIFSITILTNDTDVMQVFQAHVDLEAASDKGTWRQLWFVPSAVETIPIVDQALSTDGNVVLATLADDPGMAGTQYTYLAVTTGNGKFITKGVQTNDTVRYLYSIDAFGNTTYSEFTVSVVVNEDTVILKLPGGGAAVSVPQRVEIWRNLARNDIANNLAIQATAVADKHVRFLWPDLVEDTTGTINGYFLAAAFAGFTAGIAPHQGVQGIPVSGFVGASRSVSFFSNAQLNILANAGFFTVTQDGQNNVFARNAITTDISAAENKQEVVVRNDDATQHVLYNRVAQFFGVANITDAGVVLVRSELQGGIQVLSSFTFINRLGNMIISGEVTDVRPSVVEPDELIAQIQIERPFPVDDLLLNMTFTTST